MIHSRGAPSKGEAGDIASASSFKQLWDPQLESQGHPLDVGRGPGGSGRVWGQKKHKKQSQIVLSWNLWDLRGLQPARFDPSR